MTAVTGVTEGAAAGALSRARRPRAYALDVLPADLPTQDVRLTPELAHRRLLVAMLRVLSRWGVLLTLDAAAATVAYRTLPPVLAVLGHGVVITTLLLLVASGSYQAGAPRRSLARVLVGTAMAAGIILAVSGAGRRLEAWQGVAVYAALVAALVGCARAGVEALVRFAYGRGIGLRRAILVGSRRELQTARRLLRDGTRDQQVVGFVSVGPRAERGALGTMVDLPELLRAHDAEELLIAARLPGASLEWATEVAFAGGARCFAVPWALDPSRARAEPVRLGALPAFRLHPAEFELPEFLLKRTLDLTLTAVLLVVAVPLAALVALAIWCETPGPVFFRQRRVGLGGREFVMWKFRSMRRAADEYVTALGHLNQYGEAPLFKLHRDPRVTRVGRVLRRTSLDELPQLLNVLRGEMSLVGPRPPLPREVARYGPHHHARLCVLPGLTGPWQVSGRNLITDFERVIRLEREYIEHWSLGADLRILARTVGVVLSGRGAY